MPPSARRREGRVEPWAVSWRRADARAPGHPPPHPAPGEPDEEGGAPPRTFRNGPVRRTWVLRCRRPTAPRDACSPEPLPAPLPVLAPLV
ncbi:hypothetical protein GCM10017752_61470 [Streptomyces roseoviridis]